jgi:hypothetical protein
MGLLALGALVVIGVIGLNKWQELKHRKAGRGFESGHEDVLLTGRAAAPPPAQAPVEPATERVEPSWDTADEIPEIAAAPLIRSRAAAAQAEAPLLDDRIDFIAELVLETPLAPAAIAGAVASFDQARFIGCDGFNAEAHGWEAPMDGNTYAKIRIGMQLTDRSGPVKEADLAAFQQAVEELAAAHGAQVAWTGAAEPLTNAAALDAFCAEVDVQIGISLVAAASFAETKFRGLAEANGFQREEDGVFRRRDDAGREVLALRQSAPAAVTLNLDVPRVPRDAAAFGLMAHCARTLAKGLDARIVDDNQRALDEPMLLRIGQGITGIQGRMDAAGLPAGGALALRLFA